MTANSVHVTDALPPEVAYESDNAGCSLLTGETLSCALGVMPPGTSRTLEIQVRSTGACTRGRPTPITNTAHVANETEFAADSNVADNAATVMTTPVDLVPPTLEVSVSPGILRPPNHKLVSISAAVQAEDLCDPNPTIRLVSISSNEPDNGLGDGDTPNDIQEAALGADDRCFLLRAERSGRGRDRMYTVTYDAEDASFNVTWRSVIVTVPHSR